MIHIQTFTGYSNEDCIRKINNELDEDQIINIIPKGSKRYYGYDEYDSYTDYYIDVIYKDNIKKNKE